MKPHTLSTVLLIAGAALLILGYFEPQIKASLVTVVSDDTPPEWILNPSGTPALYPTNGAVYGTPVTRVQAMVRDLESGVTSVVGTIDQAPYPMTILFGDASEGVWLYNLVTPVTSGTHTITFVATNAVGLKTTYTGTFAFSGAIQGTWYINNVEITSSTMTVYSSTLTVNFTFVKTTGPSGTVCEVTEGGSHVVTLVSTDSITWRGVHAFTGGSHALELTASDGTSPPIIMATLSVNFGGSLDFTGEQLAMFAAGACCLGAGGYLRLPKKKR